MTLVSRYNNVMNRYTDSRGCILCLLSLLAIQLALPVAMAAADVVDAELFFVKRVLPVLKEKCFGCHGNDANDLRGGLDVRSMATLQIGGDSGEASIELKKPLESPLYLALLRTDATWSAMPPKESDKLSVSQVEAIKSWLEMEAPWPSDKRIDDLNKQADPWADADGVRVQTTGALDDDWANRTYSAEGLWAYRPVVKPQLNASELQVNSNPIDALLARSRPADMQLVNRADRRTLMRRVTYDLTGLPPTIEDLQAFVNDPSDDRTAFAKVVNRLLASPHYGEHWGRHWLDVVRYADTAGFANDYDRGNAWRYRDYVVRSFNEDKLYDQFIREQIAGDEIYEATDNQSADALIATGFLRMGPWELTSMEVPKIARQRFLDDVTNSVGEVFLSHSLQCARCHDHKFDPIPTHDYYSIQACFATTQLVERSLPFTSNENTKGFEERKYLERSREVHEAEVNRLNAVQMKAALDWFAQTGNDATAWQAEAKRVGDDADFAKVRYALSRQGIAEDKYPPRSVGFTPEDFGRERVARKGLERLKWEFDRYEPFALAVYNGVTVNRTNVLEPIRLPSDRNNDGVLEQTAILSGGDAFSASTSVQPNVLSALVSFRNEVSFDTTSEVAGRRTALANWIANPRNPLTTRSIVNRVWLWHFGTAIAGNPNNFGSTGKRPTHPELLDWLAADFVDQGWSMKQLHRTILSSDAYARSCDLVEATKFSREELEANHAIFKPRRLMAEEIRDSMLTVSGELNRELGGIPNRPEINLEAALQPRQVMGTFASAWVPNPLPQQRHRRSLYALRVRGLRDPLMEVFNEPAPDFSCEARETSTVTPQVFALFNGQPTYDRALAVAHLVMTADSHSDDVGLMTRLFKQVLSREPTESEAANLKMHFSRMQTIQENLTYASARPPIEVVREAVEENTGEKFTFIERLYSNEDFVLDLQPSDVDARTRALADIALVLLNTNEFLYVY
jgi:mono/diheme cytochrome c family protein